jgi:CelD/BcsL family acetyltransferase involved in cellulose biosynthesis
MQQESRLIDQIPAAGRPPRADLRCQLVRGAKALTDLRPHWLRITAEMAHKRFFHLYPWHASYFGALEHNLSAMNALVIYDGATPAGIVPLKRTAHDFYGIRLAALELPRHAHVPLSDIVLSDRLQGRDVAGALRTFLSESRIEWDVLAFANVLEDGGAFALAADDSYRVALPTRRCDYLVRPANYDKFAKTLSKNFRANLRKARNKLSRYKGEGRLQCLSVRDPAQLEWAFEEFLHVEASGWKGQAGTRSAIQFSQRLRQYYHSLLTGFAELDGYEINLLRLDKRSIGAQLCLHAGDTNYLLKIGYDEAYAKYAPGNMLLEWLLKRGNDAQIRNINLVTDTPWHVDWLPASYQVYNVYLFNPRSSRARVVHKLMKLRSALAPVYEKYVKPFRTVAAAD